MPRTLVVTNDYPPRAGGIQAFVHSLAVRQPPGEVVVLASSWKGAAEFDARQPFPVVRTDSSLMLPTPDVGKEAARLVREHGCDTVWFGAAAPLGLLAPTLRKAGAGRFVASTHGHETGWAMTPGARQMLRRIGGGLDVVTYLGQYTKRRLQPAFGPHPEFVRLPPGVDTDVFAPWVDGSGIRRRHALGDRRTIVCVSRLVPRKGQDALIEALPVVRRSIPDATLLVVGGGPDMPRLQRLAAEAGVAEHVVFTGTVPWQELPAHYAAGHVFAMPTRTRFGGMDVEGLGIVYLEASATGLPVIAGASGGAPDAVRHGVTGYVVDGRDGRRLAERCVELLGDRMLARRMGDAGRDWVVREWRWDVLAARLREVLHPGAARP